MRRFGFYHRLERGNCCGALDNEISLDMNRKGITIGNNCCSIADSEIAELPYRGLVDTNGHPIIPNYCCPLLEFGAFVQISCTVCSRVARWPTWQPWQLPHGRKRRQRESEEQESCEAVTHLCWHTLYPAARVATHAVTLVNATFDTSENCNPCPPLAMPLAMAQSRSNGNPWCVTA